MWRLLCTLSLLLVQVAPTPAPSATPTAAPTAAPGYRVVVCMGQSNMVGWATDYVNPTPDPRILALNQTNDALVVAQYPLPSPTGANGAGSVIQFASLYLATRPSTESVIIVMCARGGTVITNEWLPTGIGTQWCINRTATAMAKPNALSVVAILWHQGESDADGLLMPASYAQHFRTLMEFTRVTFAGVSATTPILVGRMVPAWVSNKLYYNGIDRVHANVDVLLPYAGAISNANLTGDLHLDYASQLIMGTRFFDLLANVSARNAIRDAVVTTPQRVASYSFEDGFNDTSGNGNTGVSTGAPLDSRLVSGGTRSGTVYQAPATGSADNLRISRWPATMTLTFWRYHATMASPGSIGFLFGSSTGYGSGTDLNVFLAGPSWSGVAVNTFAVRLSGNAHNAFFNCPSIFTLNNWHFHAVVIDQSNATSMAVHNIIDGLRFSTNASYDDVAQAGSSNWPGMSTGFGEVAFATGFNNPDVSGRYDEIHLYNASLTPEQITGIMLQKLGGSLPPTPSPTASPTAAPTAVPTATPTATPTAAPTATPTAAPTVTPCWPGSFLDFGFCFGCAAGRYSNVTNTPGFCPECPAGRTSAPNSTTCFACDAGSFLNGTVCQGCSAGTFANDTGQTACIPCQPGRFSLPNATQCMQCAAGYAAPNAGSADCTMCLAGRFAAGGSMVCGACLAGTYSGAGADQCTDCAFGQYSNANLSTVCSQCQPGYWSPTSGANTVCQLCPPGTYSGEAHFVCTNCTNGTYAPNTASSVCLNCTTGIGNATYCGGSPTPAPTSTPTVAPTARPTAVPSVAPTATPTAAPTAPVCGPGSYGYANSSACFDCEAGTFQGSTGSTACLPCATGKFAASTGASACSRCAAGRFSNTTGRTDCFACPVNTFVAGDGYAVCTPCPTGYLAPSTGATACELDTTPVAQTVVRLNRTQVAVWVPPSVTVVVEPLTAVPCSIPTGWRVLEAFDLTGAFATPAELRFTSNTTTQLWPTGRDLFVCVAGDWLPSYTYACGGNVTRPGRCTRDVWLSALVCHNTPFAAMEPVPSEKCSSLPRLCANCTDGFYGCGCDYAASSAYGTSTDVMALALVGVAFLMAATFHRIALEGWTWTCHGVATATGDDDEDESAPMVPGGSRNDRLDAAMSAMSTSVAAVLAALGTAAWIWRLYGAGENTWSTGNVNRDEFRLAATFTFVIYFLLHILRVSLLTLSGVGSPGTSTSRCFYAARVIVSLAESSGFGSVLLLFATPVYEAHGDSWPNIWQAFISVAMPAVAVDVVLGLFAALRAARRTGCLLCVNLTLRMPLWIATAVLWGLVSVRFPCE